MSVDNFKKILIDKEWEKMKHFTSIYNHWSKKYKTNENFQAKSINNKVLMQY